MVRRPCRETRLFFMKRVLCPKCDNYITFDETKYTEGQSLVFVCDHCKKTIQHPYRKVQTESNPVKKKYWTNKPIKRILEVS